MAIKRLVIDGYGQIEINNCAFRRDGRIEAQCKPYAGTEAAPGDFYTDVVENGMLLMVDTVNRLLRKPDATLTYPVALNYSTEHIYDERTPGLKNFYAKGTGDFLPRLGYLSVGDKFTENCISYDNTEWADDNAFKTAMGNVATTPIYAGVCADGSLLVSATKPTVGPVLRVIKKTTMPDGQFGLKFQVYEC